MDWLFFVKILKKSKFLKKFITIKSSNPQLIIANLYENILKRYPNIMRLEKIKITDLDVPQIDSLKKLAQLTNSSPKQIISDLKNGKIDAKIKKLTKTKKEELNEAFETDINQAPLSSSFLAYGTFLPEKQNKNLGKLIVVTKTGEKLKIHKLLRRSQWREMTTIIGVTRYDKKGMRVGSSYGAGTLLHRFAPPKKYRWQKLGFSS